MDDNKDQEESKVEAEGAEADETNINTEDGDNTSSKTGSEQGKPKVQDMAEYVGVREEDSGRDSKQYRIALICDEDNVRLKAGEEPKATINEKNVLKVKVGEDRIYYRKRLPAEVVKHTVTKRGDRIIILLDKKKHEKWKK